MESERDVWMRALVKIGYPRDHEAAFTPIGDAEATVKLLEWLSAVDEPHQESIHCAFVCFRKTTTTGTLWSFDNRDEWQSSMALALAAAVLGVPDGK